MTKYLYICSHRHSGSTLLDLFLGAHSKIESLGEIDFLPQDLALNDPCSCGSSIRDCQVWREVIERLSAKLGVDIRANPYVLHLGYPKASGVNADLSAAPRIDVGAAVCAAEVWLDFSGELPRVDNQGPRKYLPCLRRCR